MIRRFRDWYGGTAIIRQGHEGTRLTVTVMGKRIISKTYATERGARIAMGRVGEGWKEVMA